MSGHTPGPWSYADDGKSVWGDGGAEVICSIYECDSSQDSSAFYGEITQANARLIESAPELLAALQNLMTWRHGNENVPPGHNGNEPWNWAADAIAKATGETK